jgi:sugar-specific transcriptional regulator TrmB
MQKITILLERLGLGKTEIATYIYLVQHGEHSISDISRSLSIHRPLIYKALEELQEKGIASITFKGKQKRYIAENPAKLRTIVKDLTVDLEEALPDLEDLYVPRSSKPAIKYFEGRKGITAVFADVVTSLKKGETFYRYTSEKDLDKVNSYLPKDYRKIRDEKKLERLVISNPISGSKKKARLDRFIKFIGTDDVTLFQQNAIQLIYGNKIALIDLNSESSLIIENQTLADFQKAIFKMLYKKL